MAKQSPIKIKTETERMLYDAYLTEKSERQNLQVIINDLKQQITQLQQQLAEYKEKINAMDSEKIPKKPQSSQPVEYTTDEEELAKETEWIRQKSRKKRKLQKSPTLTDEETPTTEPSHTKIKTKKVPQPPPIVVDGIDNYQNFYDFLKQHVSGETFTIKMGTETVTKITQQTVTLSSNGPDVTEVVSLQRATDTKTEKSITDKTQAESKKPKTRIPKLRFRQAVDKVRRERRSVRKKNEPETSQPTPRRSSIPRLKESKMPCANIKESTPQKMEETETSPKIEDEFDKLYDDLVDGEDSDDNLSIASKVEDPIKLESTFEEIRHAYEENKIQPINVEKVKQSKIPLLKRKSEQEIEVPKQSKTTVKQSASFDSSMITSSSTTEKQMKIQSATLNKSPVGTGLVSKRIHETKSVQETSVSSSSTLKTVSISKIEAHNTEVSKETRQQVLKEKTNTKIHDKNDINITSNIKESVKIAAPDFESSCKNSIIENLNTRVENDTQKTSTQEVKSLKTMEQNYTSSTEKGTKSNSEASKLTKTVVNVENESKTHVNKVQRENSTTHKLQRKDSKKNKGNIVKQCDVEEALNNLNIPVSTEKVLQTKESEVHVTQSAETQNQHERNKQESVIISNSASSSSVKSVENVQSKNIEITASEPYEQEEAKASHIDIPKTLESNLSQEEDLNKTNIQNLASESIDTNKSVINSDKSLEITKQIKNSSTKQEKDDTSIKTSLEISEENTNINTTNTAAVDATEKGDIEADTQNLKHIDRDLSSKNTENVVAEAAKMDKKANRLTNSLENLVQTNIFSNNQVAAVNATEQGDVDADTQNLKHIDRDLSRKNTQHFVAEAAKTDKKVIRLTNSLENLVQTNIFSKNQVTESGSLTRNSIRSEQNSLRNTKKASTTKSLEKTETKDSDINKNLIKEENSVAGELPALKSKISEVLRRIDSIEAHSKLIHEKKSLKRLESTVMSNKAEKEISSISATTIKSSQNEQNKIINHISATEIVTEKTGSSTEQSEENRKILVAEEQDEEDIPIIKGKVDRMLRRITSVETNAKPVKKDVDEDILKNNRIVSAKIAMFERSESVETLPKTTTRYISQISRIKNGDSTETKDISTNERPKIVEEVLKAMPAQVISENKSKHIHRTETEHDNYNINYKDSRHTFDTQIVDMQPKSPVSSLESTKEVTESITNTSKKLFSSVNKEGSLHEMNPATMQKRDSNLTFTDSAIISEKVENKIKNGANEGEYQPVYLERTISWSRRNIAENSLNNKEYSNNSNFKETKNESYAIENRIEVVSDVKKHEIKYEPYEVNDDNTHDNNETETFNRKTRRNEGQLRIHAYRNEQNSNIKTKSKSLADLDLEDTVKGKVKNIVVRMNSSDRFDTGRKDFIDAKERPRKRSVLEKIALFEGKSTPVRSDRPEPLKLESRVFQKELTQEYRVRQSMQQYSGSRDGEITPVTALGSPKRKSTPIKTERPDPKLDSQEAPEELSEEDVARKVEELLQARSKYGCWDQERMQYQELRDGGRMPVIGIGTALLNPKLARYVVQAAIDLGYRTIDTAYIYGNEKEVGEAINEKIKDGTVKREDLFIISKLWSTFHRKDLVEKACRASLEAMGLDYFDLYLIHNPMSFKEGSEPVPKIASVVQFSQHDYLDAWYGVEDLVRAGLVRRGGVSNFNSLQVDRLVEKGKIKPVINQVECHPYLSQNRLDDFCQARNVKLCCFGVLGSKGTPRKLKSGLPPAIEDPLVRVMAAGLGVSPAVLLISYQLSLGRSVVVKASSAAHLWDCLQALALRPSPADISGLHALNRNKRIFTFQGMGDTHKNYPFNIPF